MVLNIIKVTVLVSVFGSTVLVLNVIVSVLVYVFKVLFSLLVLSME